MPAPAPSPRRTPRTPARPRRAGGPARARLFAGTGEGKLSVGAGRAWLGLALALAPASAQAELGGPHQNDRFGAALAAEGAHVVIGSPGDNDDGFDAGAVFLYARDGDRWRLDERVAPDEPVARQGFGASVALAGATLVVGTAPPDGRGAAYVFHRTAYGWQESARLGLDADDHAFAARVYAADAWVAAYAPFVARGLAWSEAEVHLYKRTGDGYAPRQVLRGVPASGFLMRGDLLLLGEAGALAAYTLVDGAWERTATLSAGEGLSGEVAWDGETAWALGVDGRAFAFRRAGETWSKGQAVRLPEDAQTLDFGPLAISGEWAVVRERRWGGGDDIHGLVHVFERVDGDWQRRPALTRGAVNDDFGAAIAAEGAWLWIGAPSHGEGLEGAAWAYQRGPKALWGLYEGIEPARVEPGCAVSGERGGAPALVLLLALRRRRRRS